MRTFCLSVFAIVAAFGIPRSVNEIRAALDEKVRPAVAAVVPATESQPVPAMAATATPAQEPASAKLTPLLLEAKPGPVVTVQPVEQGAAPAKQAKETSLPRDDDYLPPWMRGSNQANADTNPAAETAPAAAPAVTKQARRHRRRERRWDYASYARWGGDDF